LVDILADSGIGVNGAGQFYNGLIEFSAVSFISSLAPNGMLTVTYIAEANIHIDLCIDPSCNNISAQLVWDPNKLWHVTAHFGPDRNFPGGFDFLNASFAVVPEPSSMVLVGSGIMVLIRKVRKAKTASSAHSFLAAWQ